MELLEQLLQLGTAGVGLAEIVTALNPASWWASGVLLIVNLIIQAISSAI